MNYYKKLPRYKQILLWWKFMPVAYCLATVETVYWVLRGCPKLFTLPDHWPPDILKRKGGPMANLRMIWECNRNLGHFRMGNYQHLEDVIKELKEKVKCQ